MTVQAPLIPPSMPSDADFLRESLAALPVCIERCTCPDHWHPLWVGIKSTGLLRGVYAQAPMLQEMLAPYWVKGGQVLVAGAADTGVLDVLASLFPQAQARYTVVDRCDAPLELIRRRAQERSLEVQTVLGDIVDAPGDTRWDLVFIHYTLSFLDAPARAAFFQTVRSRMAPGGVVVCAARFVHPAGSEASQDLGPWMEATADGMRKLYGHDPQLLQPLLEWMPAYAESRQARERAMAHVDVLRAEALAAGFQVLHASPMSAPRVTQAADLSPHGTVMSQILLLG